MELKEASETIDTIMNLITSAEMSNVALGLDIIVKNLKYWPTWFTHNTVYHEPIHIRNIGLSKGHIFFLDNMKYITGFAFMPCDKYLCIDGYLYDQLLEKKFPFTHRQAIEVILTFKVNNDIFFISDPNGFLENDSFILYKNGVDFGCVKFKKTYQISHIKGKHLVVMYKNKLINIRLSRILNHHKYPQGL